MDRERLAADFFLIAHDEFSGKLRISRDLLSCGLVGAQLAELIMANRLAVQGGRVLVTEVRGDGDEIGAYVAETSPARPARTPSAFGSTPSARCSTSWSSAGWSRRAWSAASRAAAS